MTFFWVCLGGAAGVGGRYLASGWVQRALGPSFPYGTLFVNVLGSFLLAVVVTLGLKTSLLTTTGRVALTTGVMGGFTTFSTFSYETMHLLQKGAWLGAGLNITLNVVVCLAACFLGFAAGRVLAGG